MFQLSDLPRPVIRFSSGIWRRRWIVIGVAWAVAVLGWFGVWLLPDQYESRAHVFVQTETILEPVLTGVVARPDYTRRVEVMRQQLLTRPNVEEVIYRSELDATIEARTELERRRKMDGLVDWVAGDVLIESPQEMYFIISYKNSDPIISRNVVDAVLNLLIEQDLGASLAENEAARRRLEMRIKDYRDRLSNKDQEIAAFRRAHAEELLVIEGNARMSEEKRIELTRVSEDIDQTKRRLMTLQNLMSATPRTNSQRELDALRLQLAELRSRYEESHPDIQGVVARIEQLEIGSGGAISANPEYLRLRSEFRASQDAVAGLEDREARLREELENLAFTAGQAPAVQAELTRITRDYEQTQKTYEELISRRDTLALTENLAGRGVEYQVFERPQVALEPTDPPRLLLIIGVTLGAIGAGAGAAFFLTIIEKTFSQADDLREAFGLPVLGAVSEVASKQVLLQRRQDYLRLGAASASLFVVAFGYIYLSVLRTPSDLKFTEDDATAQSHFTERLR